MTTQEYLNILSEYEAAAVRFLPNVIWEKAEGYYVTDTEGVTRIDFCAGAMIANSGHNCKEIIDAIKQQLDTGIYTTYLFPNKARCELLMTLSQFIPPHYQTAFLNTGAEAVESSIKIARIYAHKVLKNRGIIVSFKNSYHGRMLGTTAIGGIEGIKYWVPKNVIQELAIHVPFPTCPYESQPQNFSDFLIAIKKSQVAIGDIAAVIIEPYQGGSCAFLTPEYAKDLRAWCDDNKILLISDEVQSGMGRTGKIWGYEYLEIIPDIIASGKGLSASMPLSAVIARKDLFDLCEVGNFNTTHSGNPVCCAAANANLKYMMKHQLVSNAEKMGRLLHGLLTDIRKQYPWFIEHVLGKGLAQAILLNIKYKHLVKLVVDRCIKNGLLLISPGGVGGTTIKLIPPLIIDEKGIKEACAIIYKSVSELIREKDLMGEHLKC